MMIHGIIIEKLDEVVGSSDNICIVVRNFLPSETSTPVGLYERVRTCSVQRYLKKQIILITNEERPVIKLYLHCVYVITVIH